MGQKLKWKVSQVVDFQDLMESPFLPHFSLVSAEHRKIPKFEFKQSYNFSLDGNGCGRKETRRKSAKNIISVLAKKANKLGKLLCITNCILGIYNLPRQTTSMTLY